MKKPPPLKKIKRPRAERRLIMSNTTSSVRFTLNFANKAIVGTKASFAKAGKGTGDVYEELVALMAKHPDFGFEVKAPKKPAKPKQSYKGMDIPFMLDYLAAVKDTQTRDRLEAVLEFAEKNGKSKYPLVKRSFFEVYEGFDYAVAKKVVSKYRHKVAVAEAMKNYASNPADAA